MIAALERLRALRGGALTPGRIGLLEREVEPDDLPEPWRELYEERAAIREHLGRQVREHAEAEALQEIIERMHAARESE